MGRLAVRRVEYSGEKYEFSSPELPDGLVIVEGENRTGKSTFADLILFALGGSVRQFLKKSKEPHREIQADTDNFVRLEIEIDEARFAITRRFDSHEEILVATLAEQFDSSDVEVLPVNRYRESRIFSDWLLEKLGIRSITLFSGVYSGRLNFSDLMRLMYHDQDPNPATVFMRPDRESFVSDSREFRRAIFEILIGGESEVYYELLGKVRLAQKILSEHDGALSTYRRAVSQLSSGREDVNAHFLQQGIEEAEAQIERLHSLRASVRVGDTVATPPSRDVHEWGRRLSVVELELSSIERQRDDINNERARLVLLEQQLIEEAVRIQKIIFAHETLSLFSPDTCPCCLRKVDRNLGHCICGQAVDEASYQRFFYSADEYTAILKSKQKNVVTVQGAQLSCEGDLKRIEAVQRSLLAREAKLRKQIDESVPASAPYDQQLVQLDDKIVEARVDLERLHRQLDLEQERERLEATAAAAREDLRRLRDAVSRAELDAKHEREGRISRFNALYTKLMSETLQEVRRARLSEDYEPVLNDGEYREASATVARRLMYFLALLWMSLEVDLPYPRFLLIDTPETAGIDRRNLSVAISKIPEVLAVGVGQVILTTGDDRYPVELQRFRVVKLTTNSRLLRVKVPRPS